jgi:RNA polymerase sigma-70 factor (ECF subfamily)
MDLHTTHLPDLLARMRKGERAAADELIGRCRERLERIAHAMLRTYPRVAAHEETGDVVQEASLSLLSALREVDVGDTAAFFSLAAEHVRRRLLDLARKHRAREARPPEDHDADLERWADFHEAVGELPSDLRAVFELRFYHGLSLTEVAAQHGISESTALRRWQSALAELTQRLQEFPNLP